MGMDCLTSLTRIPIVSNSASHPLEILGQGCFWNWRNKKRSKGIPDFKQFDHNAIDVVLQHITFDILREGNRKQFGNYQTLSFYFLIHRFEKEEAWSGNGFPNVTKCEIAVATPGWWRCRWPLRETVIPRTRILRWIIIVIIIIGCSQEILAIWVK